MNNSRTQLWNFPDVDKAHEPDKLIDFLDNASAMKSIREFKNQTFDLLDLKAGDRVLDVGCGTGEDVLTLAQITGDAGMAVGVDISNVMISEARKRHASSGLKAEFYATDSYELKFPDNHFDACRSERLFVHLEEPEKALREMVRVVRPGGRVICLEGDFETLIIDHPDRKLTRRILNFLCDNFPNSWVGRRLANLFKSVGLTDIKLLPVNLILSDFKSADDFWMLTQTVGSAEDEKVITPDESASWLNAMKQLDEAGLFFCSTTGFIVLARKR